MLSQILVMPFLFLLSFIWIRGLFWNILVFQLNNSARKKRRKGQTFKEWLLYSRYREEIPPFLIHLYFTFIIVNVILYIVALLLYFLNNAHLLYITFVIMICIDIGLTLILDICFYGRHKNGQTYYKVERWITKKKKK